VEKEKEDTATIPALIFAFESWPRVKIAEMLHFNEFNG